MFKGFDSRTLRLVRQLKNAYLTERATLETQTVSGRDGVGGTVRSWTLVSANVPCRLLTQGNDSNAANQIGGQEGLAETYKIAFAPPAPLNVDTRVTVNGVVYQIVELLVARTDQDEVQAIVKRDVR